MRASARIHGKGIHHGTCLEPERPVVAGHLLGTEHPRTVLVRVRAAHLLSRSEAAKKKIIIAAVLSCRLLSRRADRPAEFPRSSE